LRTFDNRESAVDALRYRVERDPIYRRDPLRRGIPGVPQSVTLRGFRDTADWPFDFNRLNQAAAGSSAISGSWFTTFLRSSLDPLYFQPSSRLRTERTMGAT
jgi:hypothetical protein